ncbi:unnamed protein product [Cuscuta europaea]|uniref:Iron-sulfur cluster biosynthesis family protein n=1 Tax=Cuscuta europaea TaxID=41803 RepID=A0A9P0YVJ1_CUSEU|nr:unnamed protein product [Cuscuta europaea]
MSSVYSLFFFSATSKSHPIFIAPKPTAFILKPQQSSLTYFARRLNIKFRPLKGSCRQIRASVDVASTSAIKPGASVESDKLPSDIRKRAMDAIDSFGGRVTAGDVASKAGLQLNEAQKALQALATDTDGFLEVSDEGDVLYVFPKSYRSNLVAKSFKLKIEPLLEKTKMAAEYLLKVSFGTTLVASIVIVYVTIISLVLSSKSDDDNRGRRSRSYDTNFTFYASPRDLFWFWDPYYRKQPVQDDSGGMNFIASLFSFVFGDGDPNQGIEEKRWKLIGQYISSNGGVVTAEELAPYLDIESSSKMDDESYILPVLLRFDGEPEVDGEGNILYRFPSLQRTGVRQSSSGRNDYGGRRQAEWFGNEKFLEEKKWQLSNTSPSQKALAIGLGGLNLFGVIILGAMLKDVGHVTVSQSSLLSLVSGIFPLLQVYAWSFFTIPAVRWILIQNRNAKIERRNTMREKYVSALERPDLSLRRKLLSAGDMAKRTFIGRERIVYSTDRDLYEQGYDAKQWEQRFRERDRDV